MAQNNTTLKREIEELARLASFMMNWLDRQATSLKNVGIDRDVHIMTGTEFVAQLSLDGYGPDKLAEKIGTYCGQMRNLVVFRFLKLNRNWNL